MRIVDRKTFIELPSGTVFSKYEPCIFGELMIKGDSIIFDGGNDFRYQSIADAVACDDGGEYIDQLVSSEKTGSEVPMDFDCQNRDGLFDSHQLFAVWSQQDIESLEDRLSYCVGHNLEKQ